MVASVSTFQEFIEDKMSKRFIDTEYNATVDDFIPVMIESPFSNPNSLIFKTNITFAQVCMRCALEHGMSGFVSHLTYTQFPGANYPFHPDSDSEHLNIGRANALEACRSMRARLVGAVYFNNFGITPGMQHGIDDAVKNNIPIAIVPLPKDRMAEVHNYAIKILKQHQQDLEELESEVARNGSKELKSKIDKIKQDIEVFNRWKEEHL